MSAAPGALAAVAGDDEDGGGRLRAAGARREAALPAVQRASTRRSTRWRSALRARDRRARRRWAASCAPISTASRPSRGGWRRSRSAWRRSSGCERKHGGSIESGARPRRALPGPRSSGSRTPRSMAASSRRGWRGPSASAPELAAELSAARGEGRAQSSSKRVAGGAGRAGDGRGHAGGRAGAAPGRVRPDRARRSVELRVATNPGIPTSPLRDAASGGELSRVMLALTGLGPEAGARDARLRRDRRRASAATRRGPSASGCADWATTAR